MSRSTGCGAWRRTPLRPGFAGLLQLAYYSRDPATHVKHTGQMHAARLAQVWGRAKADVQRGRRWYMQMRCRDKLASQGPQKECQGHPSAWGAQHESAWHLWPRPACMCLWVLVPCNGLGLRQTHNACFFQESKKRARVRRRRVGNWRGTASQSQQTISRSRHLPGHLPGHLLGLAACAYNLYSHLPHERWNIMDASRPTSD